MATTTMALIAPALQRTGHHMRDFVPRTNYGKFTAAEREAVFSEDTLSLGQAQQLLLWAQQHGLEPVAVRSRYNQAVATFVCPTKTGEQKLHMAWVGLAGNAHPVSVGGLSAECVLNSAEVAEAFAELCAVACQHLT